MSGVLGRWLLCMHSGCLKGTGLGMNTMQGREAKRVHIASYAKHSNIKNRWSLVFRHDYISKYGSHYNNHRFSHTNAQRKVLFPQGLITMHSFAIVAFLRIDTVTGKCFYCDYELTDEIVKSVKSVKISCKLSSILK